MLAETKSMRENSPEVNIDGCYKLLKNVADNGIEEAKEQAIVDIIDSLDRFNDRRFVEVLMPLATFRKDVERYRNSNGLKSFVGLKEIGVPIRLAAVKALGKLGDKKALSVLKEALQDRGDMEKEMGEVQWFVYSSGDKIQEEAKKSISKLQCNRFFRPFHDNLWNLAVFLKMLLVNKSLLFRKLTIDTKERCYFLFQRIKLSRRLMALR